MGEPQFERIQSLLLGALLALPLSMGEAHADTLCGREVVSIERLRDDVLGGSRTKKITDTDTSVQFSDDQHRVLWTFLKAAHPAAPAVLCQTPVTKDGKISLSLEAWCGGPKVKCDALIAEFGKHQAELSR
ncbi:hypothetical protein [Microvirga sp. TS319]|uniref:hypothetical protein n=1 Tax=Microvirga sp. TS319 TaxID=3241165 RepID=UPI00351A7185